MRRREFLVCLAGAPFLTNMTAKRPRAERIGDAASAIVDRFGRPAAIENLFLGGHVFLVLGGPSLRELDLSPLHDRGVVSFAVNNVAAWLRPTIWTYGDTTGKFHDVIWHDPGIMKLVPLPKLDNPIRTKRPDGRFELTGVVPRGLPNVFGVKRNSTFDPPTWLTENTINWGNGKKAAAKNGHTRVLSTMLQAVRLCYYLGFRYVYLLGADFRMNPGRLYAFDESKHDGAVRSNNNAYLQLETLFRLLRPRFDAAGFRVFNCNARSGLTAFDHLPYNAALEAARSAMPAAIDTVGWYKS